MKFSPLSPFRAAKASLVVLPLLVSPLSAQEVNLPAGAALPYEEPAQTGEVPYEAPAETAAPSPSPTSTQQPEKTPVKTSAPTSAPAKVSGGPLPQAAATPKTATVEGVARRANSRAAAKPAILRVAGLKLPTGTRETQIQFLQKTLASQLQNAVTLWDGEKAHSFTREDLGASIPYAQLWEAARKTRRDVPLRFVVDTQVAQATMKVLETRLNDAPPVQLVTDGPRFSQPPAKVQLAIAGSALRVKQALEAQPPRSRVELVVSRPQVSSSTRIASPKPAANGRYLLAAFSTPYDAGIRGRTANLRLAAQRINGKIIPVGGIFSANKAIGPRLEKDGWREAKMFVNGEIVSGTGAGICQASTTIYNAALLAGLPIVERHPHSFRVMYAPPSRDAAIYWGGKDFRFRNDTPGPIVVQTYLRGGRFHAKLYGVQPMTQKIEVVSQRLSSKKGTRSVAYRITRTANGVQREKLSSDYYRPTP